MGTQEATSRKSWYIEGQDARKRDVKTKIEGRFCHGLRLREAK
jgi:hypothetical protein